MNQQFLFGFQIEVSKQMTEDIGKLHFHRNDQQKIECYKKNYLKFRKLTSKI